MFQIRSHGRGGQGVVTQGPRSFRWPHWLKVATPKHFPVSVPIAPTRRRADAPVVSFCRIDDREIRTRQPVIEPNAIIIQDGTLIHQVDPLAALMGQITMEAIDSAVKTIRRDVR